MKPAYADRATWLGDPERVQVPVRGLTTKRYAEAQRFVDWVISPAGQQAIAAYRIGGEQLFFPNAR